MAQELRRGLKSVEATTTAALAILATGSGYWTYMGVKGLLDENGLLSLGGAIIYSVAVSVAIYAFWIYLMRFLPAMRGFFSRLGMASAMVVGCAAIIAMSSWLNAAALAGSAAVEQHLAHATEAYQQRLEQAHENALAAQTLLPDLEMAAARFRDMSAAEEASGAYSGTAGHGTVVALLTQTSGQLSDLASQVRDSQAAVSELFERGSQHLVAMRRLTTDIGGRPIAERSVAFAEEAIALAGLIVSLEQSSVAPAVKRAADGFARTFVRPAPSGGDSDLRRRQEAVVESVAESIDLSSAALSAAAAEVLARPRVTAFRFTPLSSAEAVLLYAEEFLPSWAGAIAIDMMPGVLVFMLMVIHSVVRSREGVRDIAADVTVAELSSALAALDRLKSIQERSGVGAVAETKQESPDGDEARGAEPASSVTSMTPPTNPTTKSRA